MPEQPKKLPVMANILVMGAAHSNSVFIAAADRVGTERDQPFIGCSVIVSHTRLARWLVPRALPTKKSFSQTSTYRMLDKSGL